MLQKVSFIEIYVVIFTTYIEQGVCSVWYNLGMRYNKITEKVAEVSEYLPKDAAGNVVVPVDLSVILNKYGLKVYNAIFKKPDMAGAFVRKEKVIYLDKTDPYTRKRFTAAHELGHYLLHENAEDIMYRKRSEKDAAEREADEFAAELLMPESVIRLYWTVAENIQQLAVIFGVSYSAMLNRLRHLGYI